MLKLDTVQKKEEEDTLLANIYKMNTTFHITADYHLSYNIQLQTLCLSDMGHSPENWTKEVPFPDELKIKLKHETF